MSLLQVDEEIIESLCKEHRLEGTTELLVNELEHNTTYHLELIAHNAEGNSTPANITLMVPGKDNNKELPHNKC